MSVFHHDDFKNKIFRFNATNQVQKFQVDIQLTFNLKADEIAKLDALQAESCSTKINEMYEKILNTITNKIVPVASESQTAVAVCFDPTKHEVTVNFDFPFDGRLVSAQDKYKHLIDLLSSAPKTAAEDCHPSSVSNIFDSNPLLGRNVRVIIDGVVTELSDTQVYMIWAIRNDRVVFVAGAGVSISLTGNKNSLWWPFMDGVRKAVWPETDQKTGTPAKVHFDLARWNALDSHSASEYLYYCAHLDHRLDALNAAMFLLLSQLVPKASPSLTDTWQKILKPFKGAMVTFNYDVVLEIALGRTPIDGIADSDRVVSMCRANTNLYNHVIHAHGLYTNDQSIVLQQSTYIQAAKFVPDLFCALSQQGYIFIHAGIGGGFTDPDMVPYWTWENTKHQIGQRIVNNHYVLVRDGEQKSLSLPTFGGKPASFITQVTYVNYDDLPTTLGTLLDGSYFKLP